MTDPQAHRLAVAYLAFDRANRELPVYEHRGNREAARDCRRRLAEAERELNAAVAAITEA
jgi:hypothetical protein